jgi:hypothetical protein
LVALNVLKAVEAWNKVRATKELALNKKSENNSRFFFKIDVTNHVYCESQLVGYYAALQNNAYLVLYLKPQLNLIKVRPFN